MKSALIGLSLLNAGLALGNVIILHQSDHAILFMLLAIYLLLMGREYEK